MKSVTSTFPAVALGHILLHHFHLLLLCFFFNRSHWYLAVICFPWLEEAVYEDFPQTMTQQAQAQQSQHGNKAIGDKLHVDDGVNNDDNSKKIE